LTIHELRHTYASLARASGADLRYAQKTMRHSTPTVTANIYSDLYSDELDQVAVNLDRLHASNGTNANRQEPDCSDYRRVPLSTERSNIPNIGMNICPT